MRISDWSSDVCSSDLLAALIRRGEVTPLEILKATIARIEARNPAVNAVVHRCTDEARAEFAKGIPDGPFAGLHFLLKDLSSFRPGPPCGNGSRWFADSRARSEERQVVKECVNMCRPRVAQYP